MALKLAAGDQGSHALRPNAEKVSDFVRVDPVVAFESGKFHGAHALDRTPGRNGPGGPLDSHPEPPYGSGCTRRSPLFFRGASGG